MFSRGSAGISRLAIVQEQIATINRERDEAPTPCKATEKKRVLLTQLKSIGPAISAVMSREVYYRQFNNRRQVASFLGLATSPNASGDTERPQGISRTRSWAGSRTDDRSGLAMEQASAQEHTYTMVPGPDNGTRPPCQTDHDCRRRA